MYVVTRVITYQAIASVPESGALSWSSISGASGKGAQQVTALNAVAGTWQDEDHPELAEGGAEFVEKLRAEDRRVEAERMEQLILNQPPG